MMKKYSSCHNNNNALRYSIQSKILNDNQDELSYNSQTLDIIRSIVDELYQINNQDILFNSEQKEKRVRFTLHQNELQSIEIPIKHTLENEKSSIKYQPILSESSTVVCCLNEGRLKVDRSVSTNDLPSLQCECATQTIDITINSECNYSLKTNHELDVHQSSSNIALSTTSISSKSLISDHPSSVSITSHTSILNSSLYSCEKTEFVPSLCTAHQLIIPSKAKHYAICEEQILENSNMNSLNSLTESNRRLSNETDIKFCTCLKRKLSNTIPLAFSNQYKLLEELHLSKRSLQLMYNDGLFYIHDLVLVFVKNISQFYQILFKYYHVSKKQANLFVKIMNKWWTKYEAQFIDLDKKLSQSTMIIYN